MIKPQTNYLMVCNKQNKQKSTLITPAHTQLFQEISTFPVVFFGPGEIYPKKLKYKIFLN